jgi:hypothetical protein
MAVHGGLAGCDGGDAKPLNLRTVSSCFVLLVHGCDKKDRGYGKFVMKMMFEWW